MTVPSTAQPWVKEEFGLRLSSEEADSIMTQRRKRVPEEARRTLRCPRSSGSFSLGARVLSITDGDVKILKTRLRAGRIKFP